MSLAEWLSNYWWFLFWFLPLCYLYIRQKNKDRIAGLTNYEVDLIIYIGFLLLVIYLIQRYMFSEHIFFIISLPIFILLLFWLINYLLRGNDIYILQSSIQNETIFNLADNEKIHVPATESK